MHTHTGVAFKICRHRCLRETYRFRLLQSTNVRTFITMAEFVALPRTIKLREIDDVSYTCITQGVAEVYRVVPRGRIIHVAGCFTSFTAESFQSSLSFCFIDVKRRELCCFRDIFVWAKSLSRALYITVASGENELQHNSYVIKQRIIFYFLFHTTNNSSTCVFCMRIYSKIISAL